MPLSRLYLLYFFSVLTIILVSYRIIIRKLLTYARAHGYNYRNVLFVGNNERTRKLINLINESPEFGYHILGFIDSDKTENKNNDSNGLKYLGNINNLEYIIKLMIIDEVIITLPIKSLYSEIANVINCCDDLGLNVKIATDLFSRKFSKSSVSLFGDHFFIEFYSSPLMDVQLIFKRFFDFTVSLIFIILLSPLFFILCILIMCTSKGPLLFKQTRVGYNGRFFKCLKFRSMVHNAEQMKKDLLRLNEVDGPVFKIKNDPRITPVGKFLRTYSLDELPQLFNVLKGDMSLVGPRPPTPDEVEKYKSHDRRRLSVRPGITCLWQVSGRNKLSFNEWMELDKEYIDNWSLWLDIKILFKTIPAVWRGTGV